MKWSLVAIDARMIRQNISVIDLGERTEWRFIAPTEPGLDNLADRLQAPGQFDALHLVLDCSTGAPALGMDRLTPESAGQWLSFVQAAGQHVEAQGSLRIYVTNAYLRGVRVLLRGCERDAHAPHLFVHSHDFLANDQQPTGSPP